MLSFQNIHIGKKIGGENINQKQPFVITPCAEEFYTVGTCDIVLVYKDLINHHLQ